MKQEKKYNLYLLPLLAVIVIMPLIVRMYCFDSHLESYNWYNNVSEESDFFLYYKGIFLIVMSTIMLIVMARFIYKERKRKVKKIDLTNEYWLIGLGVFLFFACFSTLVSKYRYFGVHGIADQFESIWVVIAYGVILVYAYYMVQQKNHVYTITIGVLTLCILIGTLGLFQFIGMDLWASKLGKILMVPSKYAQTRDTLEFHFTRSYKPVYLSLYNVNYVGVFCILMIPVLLAILIIAKNIWYRIVSIIAIVLMGICLIGCGSKTGILVGALLIVLAILLYARGKKKIWVVGALAALTLFLSVGYYIASGTNLFIMLTEALKPVQNQYAVTDFEIEDQDVCLTYNEHKVYFQVDISTDAGIQFRAWSDSKDDLPYYQETDGTIRFEDEDMKDISLNIFQQINNLDNLVVIHANEQAYQFTKVDGEYQYVNYCGRIDEMAKADSVVFTNYDALLSGRGYIWARTIPLLKNTIFVGTGADSFTLVFPQNDYVAKQNADYVGKIITKPHNLYLQIAVQYGILALLGFLFMYGFYFYQTMQILKATSKSTESVLARGIMISLIGYLLMGVTNDSCVTVAPLSFILLGFGFAVNRMIANQNDQEK